MELSFKNDDRDNFFNAKKSLQRHFKTVTQKIVPVARVQGYNSVSLPVVSAM
jgi:hypothetical protein